MSGFCLLISFSLVFRVPFYNAPVSLQPLVLSQLSVVVMRPCSSPSSPSSSSSSSDATASKSHHHVAILHNVRACAFDLTELQARAILMMARPPVSPKSRQDYGSAYYMWRPKGISMKRSLQRFLQERKWRSRSSRDGFQENSPCNNRIAAAANHHRHHRTDNDNQN